MGGPVRGLRRGRRRAGGWPRGSGRPWRRRAAVSPIQPRSWPRCRRQRQEHRGAPAVRLADEARVAPLRARRGMRVARAAWPRRRRSRDRRPRSAPTMLRQISWPCVEERPEAGAVGLVGERPEQLACCARIEVRGAASSVSFSSSRRLGGRSAMLSAVADHDDAVAEAEQLLEIGGDHDDRDARGGDVAQDRVDRGARADVDALGRLVEDQHPRLEQEPARDDDLLLHAAGEVEHAGIGSRSAGRPSSASSASTCARGCHSRGRSPGARRDGRGAGSPCTERSGTMFWARRSSATKPMPARMASLAGAWIERLSARRERCRHCAARRPKSASTVSERPAPTRPPRPRISPCRTAKETSRTVGGARDLADERYEHGSPAPGTGCGLASRRWCRAPGRPCDG